LQAVPQYGEGDRDDGRAQQEADPAPANLR
jgi:hypothetical protein